MEEPAAAGIPFVFEPLTCTGVESGLVSSTDTPTPDCSCPAFRNHGQHLSKIQIHTYSTYAILVLIILFYLQHRFTSFDLHVIIIIIIQFYLLLPLLFLTLVRWMSSIILSEFCFFSLSQKFFNVLSSRVDAMIKLFTRSVI